MVSGKGVGQGWDGRSNSGSMVGACCRVLFALKKFDFRSFSRSHLRRSRTYMFSLYSEAHAKPCTSAHERLLLAHFPQTAFIVHFSPKQVERKAFLREILIKCTSFLRSRSALTNAPVHKGGEGVP